MTTPLEQPASLREDSTCSIEVLLVAPARPVVRMSVAPVAVVFKYCDRSFAFQLYREARYTAVFLAAYMTYNVQGGPQKWHSFLGHLNFIKYNRLTDSDSKIIFENRLIFDKAKVYQKNCAIFWGHPVHSTSAALLVQQNVIESFSCEQFENTKTILTHHRFGLRLACLCLSVSLLCGLRTQIRRIFRIRGLTLTAYLLHTKSYE